ncbi:MAG: flagellar basal-body rod protein FlgF [Clostridia bacterium]|nr:flagellar basal-body rod protein FlgF [Clostridia bacterium]
MVRGIYSAGTAMLTQRKKMDIIANNIANATTNGFKQDNMISRSFKDMLISKTNSFSIINTTSEVGPINTGIHVDEVATNFSTGAITQTGNYTDVAIEGDGFFVINTDQGPRYTKDGAFKVNAEGYLVNQDGQAVMGENGQIYVGNNKFSVNQNGEIYINEQYVDRLQIASFADTTLLRKEGNNLYNNTGSAIVQSDVRVEQGALEASNVDVISQVVDMMQVYRNYEANQKIIQTMDSTLEKAVNELGKV